MHDSKDQNFVDARIRVRYAETDQMAVAYYANYLVWFEVARTEFCRKRGVVYAELEKETETFLPVVEAFCRYRVPVVYDQELLIRVRVERFHKRTLTFSYKILCPESGRLHAEGETKHVFTNRAGRPKSLPKAYWSFFEGAAD